jgi:hypothetical protein
VVRAFLAVTLGVGNLVMAPALREDRRSAGLTP